MSLKKSFKLTDHIEHVLNRDGSVKEVNIEFDIDTSAVKRMAEAIAKVSVQCAELELIFAKRKHFGYKQNKGKQKYILEKGEVILRNE